MGIIGKSPLTGLAILAVSAFLLQGCAVAVVGAVAGGGAVGYGFSQEKPQNTASAAPAAVDEADPKAQPTPEPATTATSEPVMLVEPQAPVDAVEVQTLQ